MKKEVYLVDYFRLPHYGIKIHWVLLMLCDLRHDLLQVPIDEFEKEFIEVMKNKRYFRGVGIKTWKLLIEIFAKNNKKFIKKNDQLLREYFKSDYNKIFEEY